MTVAPVSTETSYLLTGTTTGPFATVWPYAQATDVQVWLHADGADRQLTSPGDFTIASTGPLLSGGDVTLLSGPTGAAWNAGDKVTLVRVSADGQAAALGEVTGFSPKSAEDALDAIERQVQDIRSAQLERVLRRFPGADVFEAGDHAITGLAISGDPTAAATVGQLATVAGGGPLDVSAAWADITGKPASFPPSPHSAALLTDLASVLGGLLAAGSGIAITYSAGAYHIASTSSGAVASVQGHTGAVVLTSQEISGVASLKDYGGVCDGDPVTMTGTDDTGAWTDAIADINAGVIGYLIVPGFSLINGALPTVTGSHKICGLGHARSGIIAASGGDVTMYSVDYTAGATNVLRSQHRFSMEDLYLGTMQGALGQALSIHVKEESFVDLKNVHVSGWGSRFGTPKRGWKRGIEGINITSSSFHNVTVQGCVDPTGALTYPDKVLVTDFAWYMHADTGHSTTNNRWSSCDVIYVNKAWKCEGGNIQGFFWTDCTPAWVGTGWSINMTEGTWGPCFGWKGGSPECIHRGIDATNVAYLDIAQMTFLMDQEYAEVRKAINLTSCFQANVHENMLVNIAALGPAGTRGSCDFLVATDCTKIKSHHNQISDLDSYGVRFTGTTNYSETVDDRVYFPAAGGVPFKNEASGGNLLTNKRRRMTIDGGTSAQGASPVIGKDTTVTTITSTQTAMLQLLMGMEPGDQIRVTYDCFTQVSGANEAMPVFVVREYNHRPSAGVPFQILQREQDIKNLVQSGHLTTIKGQHYFAGDAVFDVIASATDALVSLELYSDPTSGHNFTYNYSQMKVERL